MTIPSEPSFSMIKVIWATTIELSRDTHTKKVAFESNPFLIMNKYWVANIQDKLLNIKMP